MNDVEAADLLRLVRAGSSIRDLTQGSSAKFKPESGYRKRAATHPAWHKELLAASEANRRAKISAFGQRRYGRMTHCRSGHPYTGDNVGIRPIRGTRYCRACASDSAIKSRPLTCEEIDRIKVLVSECVPLSKIVKRGPFRVASFRNVKHQRSIDPVFNRLIGTYVAGAFDRLKASRVPPTLSIYNNAGMFAAFTDTDFRQIRSMTPAGLPAGARDDVAQEIVLALIEGRIDRAGVPRHMAQFVNQHYRMNGSMWFARGRLLSLDDAMFDDGGGSLYDITQGLWA